MNRITERVQGAVRQQLAAVAALGRAADSMKRITEDVSATTQSQRRGGDVVANAAGSIMKAARENLVSIEEVAAAASRLAQNSEALNRRIQVFRVH
jgi:methyl-accepting chemotaxis protein